MKRTLAVTLAALALAATGVHAQSLALPQPSFVDHVPLQAEDLLDSTGGRTAIAITRKQDMPQPSFMDHVPSEGGKWSTGSSQREIAHNFPAPSFVDYPTDVASGQAVPARPMLGSIEAGSSN